MKSERKKPSLPALFLSDLRRIRQEPESGLAPEFFDELRYVHETDPSEDVSIEDLKTLESELKRWGDDCGREVENELANLRKDHPVKCPISLLGTRGYGRLEIAHTRTLAYLLNPKETHGFGNTLLESLLCHLCDSRKQSPFDVEKVYAELFYRNSEEKDAGRTDIWIEGFWKGTANRKRGLIVIEAKVGGPEGHEQLSRYDKEIKKRLIEHAITGHEVYRIFLTREGDEGKTSKIWTPLSFSDLVRIFWDAASSLTSKPGYHYLRFYLAGVLKDILDLPIDRDGGHPNRYKLLGFLKQKADTTQKGG